MKHLSTLLFVLAVIVVLVVRFPDFFQYGNSRVIEPWGDGYKTYHAYLYHIRHDSTASHFAGMNYPYGEHVVPGDCEPFLSNAVRLLRWLGWSSVDRYAIGILHFSLLLGILLGAWFLFLIFRRLELPAWYAGPAALGLTFLAPQMPRLIAHFGLARLEFLPILFYLLLRYEQEPHWRWGAWMGVTVWVFAAFHFYFFAIAAFTIFGYFALRWLLRRDWPRTPAYLAHGSLALLAPLLFYYWWMIHADPVTDRNPAPWGFFAYRAHWEGLFTSLRIPHWSWFNEQVLRIRQLDYEAWNYVGTVATVFALASLTKWRRPSWLRLTQLDGPRAYLSLIGLCSVLILLFALGLPFILPGGEKLLKYSGPLQQFRSIGRFAWVFYYAINILAFYQLFRWSRGAGRWKKGLLALALLVLGYEAYFSHTRLDVGLDPIEEFAPGQAFTDIDSVDFSRYQAVVPVPYFNIGSGSFWWEQKGFAGQKSATLSIQTGLPMTAAMLTRSSLRQTLNQLQLVTEPYRPPALLEDLPNRKPLLLLWDAERAPEFGDRYTHLTDFTEKVLEKGPISLYAMPLESFAARLDQRREAVAAALDSLPEVRPGWYAADTAAQWFYDGFDEQAPAAAYRGQGGLEGVMAHWNRLLDTVWTSEYTGELVLSCWMYLNRDRNARTELRYRELDALTGELITEQGLQARQAATVFDSNGWVLLEWRVPRQRPHSRLTWIMTNEALGERELWVDEVLLRPAGLDLYRRLGDGRWWNNRFYPG